MSTVERNRSLSKNTGLLYIRMIITMVISLYTSRVVLSTLGVTDFGIYNVVGGIVIMFGFLNHAMTASTQRFLTFELGKPGDSNLKKVFSISITLHIVIAFFILLLSETAGVWFLNAKLNIPAERMAAANWVFQFSILTFLVQILTVPYNSILIAYEKMNIYAYLNIAEVLLKLLVVYVLQVITDMDKLAFYAGLIFGVSLVVRIIYIIYSLRNFKESYYSFLWDKSLFAEMVSFALWNLFGVFAGIAYNQGVNIILNIFFGPGINTARGIAFQVMGTVNQLVGNFQLAINPAITKAYASGDKSVNTLVFSSSKFSFFLLLLFIVPLYIKADYVLALWLKDVPEYTVAFTRLVLIDVLICSLSGPLQILAQATGRVRKYQLVVSIILLFNLPVSYMLLRLGYDPQATFIVSIVLSFIAMVARLIVLRSLAGFPVGFFFKNVLIQLAVVTLIVSAVLFYLKDLFEHQLANLVFISVSSTLVCTAAVWTIGLSGNERLAVKRIIKKS